ncbi:AIPR family protein [Falsiruegeria mediterranea]
MSDLEEFHHQLIADVQGDADALGLIVVEAFLDKIGEILSEAGEIGSTNRAYYEGKFGRALVQIDGYGGDPRDSNGVLSLLLCDFESSAGVRTVRADKINPMLNRLKSFLTASRSRDFRDGLEETSAGFGVADLVSTTWNQTEKIKLIAITNAESRARADAFPAGEIDGKPVTYNVWDLKRIKKFVEQGQAREDLVVNFDNDFGGSIPVLRASGSDATLESYMAVIPGTQLAAIYEKWGPRLLESNVRSFLQARSKVNKGIRDTIRDEPHMFLAYNNGIAATADSVELDKSDDGLVLKSVNNFQIVNGGQTTASVHAARKDFSEQLSSVFVQMKLNIVPPEQSETVVPKISEYANSQNKVNAADFFSNHPFHIRMEELSRKILAPPGQDGYRETKWFYERARGQYADERGRRTIAERKKFDAEYPRNQFFTKTDLAKYENTWGCAPHTVSTGAQKNFTTFATSIGKRWGKDGKAFGEIWFKRLIAKGIVFKRMEKLVSAAAWYEGGYRANIVTHGIAKVVHDAEQRDLVIDLDRVWRMQTVPSELLDALEIAGAEAQAIITNPESGMRNMSEWAKKQACWEALSKCELCYSEDLDKLLITPELAAEVETASVADEHLTDNANTSIEVFELGADFWQQALDFGMERRLLSPKQVGVMTTCTKLPNQLPSDKQCQIAMDALNKLEENGFQSERTAA